MRRILTSVVLAVLLFPSIAYGVTMDDLVVRDGLYYKNLTATICLTIAVLLGSVGVSWSANFQKGWTAYGTAIILSDIPSGGTWA